MVTASLHVKPLPFFTYYNLFFYAIIYPIFDYIFLIFNIL